MRARSGAVASLAALCVLSPLLVGGVLPAWTPIVLAVLALGWSLAVGLREGLPAEGVRPARWLLLQLALPAVVIAGQLVPLPSALLRWLSPQAAQARESAASWLPLALDPAEATWELTHAGALLGLAALVLVLSPRRRERRLLLDSIILAGVLQALVAAVHALAQNRRSILWLYALPQGWDSGLGTFVNRNHAASLLLLGGALAAGGVAGGRHRLIYGAALAAQLVTLLCSGSRAALGATLGMVLMLVPALAERRRNGWLVFGASLGAALLLGAAALVLFPEYAARLRPLLDGSIRYYQKVRVWEDTLVLLQDYPLFGVGAGAFQSAFPAYRTWDEYVLVPYPASLPLQHAAALGLPAAALLWFTGLALARSLWRVRQQIGPLERAALIGVLGIIVQCGAEYSLELLGVAIPAVVSVAVATAGISRGEAPAHRLIERRLPLMIAAALSCALAGLALWVRPRLLAHEKGLLRAAIQQPGDPQAERLFERVRQHHPIDFNVALLGASAALRGDLSAATTLERVNRVLRLHPADLPAHRIAAQALWRAGRPRQAASELRLAFWRGLFPGALNYQQAEALVGKAGLVDLVRQHKEELAALATYLEGAGRRDLAQLARQRAALAAGQPPAAQRR